MIPRLRTLTNLKTSWKVKKLISSQVSNWIIIYFIGTIRQVMFERIEEGLNTKIPKENKGFQLLLKLGFKEGETLGKK